MRLTNYWWLLIWLFTGGVFLAALFPRQRELVCGRPEYRWHWLPATLLVLPYWMWATWRSDSFGDTGVYRQTFKTIPDSLTEIGPYLAENTKDKGFYALEIVFKALISHSDIVFFGIIAAFQIWAMVRVFRKYSPNYWISIFLFVISTDYLSWMQNGMRQFIATTMIFAAFTWMLEKRWLPLILVILLASTIHGSALIMLPIVFIVQGRALNKKTVYTLLAMLLVVLMIDKFTPLLNDLLAETQYSDMIGNEIWSVDDGTNILRVLVYSVPALLAILGKPYLREADHPVMNLCANCSLITMGLYAIAAVSSGIYIGRLPIYTTLMGYISMPWLINHVFAKRTAQLVTMAMITLFIAFFYVQMHFTWTLI